MVHNKLMVTDCVVSVDNLQTIYLIFQLRRKTVKYNILKHYQNRNENAF